MNKKLDQFQGRHWETGSIHNALALQGVKAPHTGKPYSEAFLLGVSGGIAFGYFTFEYKGILPHVALLIRNTFDPFQTILERLGVVQHVYQTGKAEIAEKNLTEALASGNPAIVWADECSLPYNNMTNTAYWNMMPLVVYAMDGDDTLIADRSSRPFRVPMNILTKARARVKDDKFRLITLDPPQTTKLVSAAQKGIWQCIELFTEKPPRGSRHNFGFGAYEHLAEMLVNIRNRQSWERMFTPGPRMYNALAGTAEGPGVFPHPGAFSWIMTWGAGDGAERAVYADFLDEALILLEKKSLKKVADQFRLSHQKWLEFAETILPEDVPLFYEAKSLKLQKHKLFIEKGEAANEEIRELNLQLKRLEGEAKKNFPLKNEDAAKFRANLRGKVLAISDVERKAIEMLQGSMG
jgi:hypothetical protein